MLLLFLLFNEVLNYTFYNPSFITPVYGFVTQQHLVPVFEEEQGIYPLTSIRQINSGLYQKPRAAIEGVVTDKVKAADGDWHIDITGPDGTLVTEFIPEYATTTPALGDRIQLWGITRYDIDHRWWEIHPVIGWKQSIHH